MPERTPRPFADTQAFMRQAYEKSFGRETPVAAAGRVDLNRPYTLWNGQYFQAEFNQTIITQYAENLPDEYIPFLMTDKDNLPQAKTPAPLARPNAALLYIFGDQSLQAIGDMYNVSRESVRKYVETHVEDMWRHSDSLLRQSYPLGELRLDRRDLDIPKEPQPAPEPRLSRLQCAVQEIKNPETTLERLCELITEFNNPFNINTYKQGENPVLTAVAKVQWLAWQKKDPRKSEAAYHMLKAAGLPVHEVPATKQGKDGKPIMNRIILTRCLPDAVEVLKKADESYKGIPVQLVLGPDRPIPTPSQLRNDFIAVTTFLTVCGISPTQEVLDRVSTNPPTSIFEYNGTYYLDPSEGQGRALLDYIQGIE